MIIIENKKSRSNAGGRPRKEIDKRTFLDLVGIGCTAEEVCWFFRDESGKAISIDTLTRWCKREFGESFAEFRNKNGSMLLKIQLRRNQFDLSKKSAAMAIFLGKNYLGQRDEPEAEQKADDPLTEMLKRWDDAARE